MTSSEFDLSLKLLESTGLLSDSGPLTLFNLITQMDIEGNIYKTKDYDSFEFLPSK